MSEDLPPTPPKTVELKMVLKTDDPMPYQKADLVQVTRFQDIFALNFYQLNYAYLAENRGQGPDRPIFPTQVAKIVMNKDDFMAFFEGIKDVMERSAQ